MFLLFQANPGFRLYGCIHFQCLLWTIKIENLLTFNSNESFQFSFKYFTVFFSEICMQSNNIYQNLMNFSCRKNKHRHHKYISNHYWRRGTHTVYDTWSISHILFEQQHNDRFKRNATKTGKILNISVFVNLKLDKNHQNHQKLLEKLVQFEDNHEINNKNHSINQSKVIKKLKIFER